ncbi:hypothetical protein QMK19_23430 [Streptomyces sp. H10-C2]|uniref:hypothetical protein n=1 Tax=unclassified Streptomyces TaxID=2593676 RepID=UPI0024B9A9ED|nr:MULTISPECIES: hypothetical protein [unclassified Streptomyces]MDJ0342754.1 hypothetical protein [Streptomyces sp. PH10-H1]MDJ0372536.1 hypothetical protein [Streptomyces sp. H10-C2]
MDIYYPLDQWVDITPRLSWVDTEWGSQATWARSTADTMLALRGQPHRWLTIRRLAKALTLAYDGYSKHPIGERSYLLFGALNREPFHISVAYAPAEGARMAALRRLTRSDDPELMRPPQVDEFHAGHLGPGLRALGHVVLDDNAIVANLWYAFRDETHQVDVVVFASTGDLVRLNHITPDIDALVHGIKVRADDEEGWWAGVADDIPAGAADD